jgi:hypothetical protein
MGSDGFDKNRHFAFLRDHENHTLLIAANFSGTDTRMKLRIPEHAFEWMGIPITENLNTSTEIEVDVPAFNGTIVNLI